MNDLISRQAAIDLFPNDALEWDTKGGYIAPHLARRMIEELPFVQPDHVADIGKKVERTDETAQNVQNEDLISRKWLVECIEEGWVKFDTAKDCNRMMHLVRDIAPSVQPEQNAQDEDLISRKAAIEALARMMPRSYTPDGSHPADEEIFRAQEVIADCIEALEILTPAQPDNQTNLCDSCDCSYPDCPSKYDDVIFGNGIGNDNICACNKYKPSAQPERKRGEWIGHPIKGTGSLSIDEDTCSRCGKRFYQIGETGAVWNFCPNCGADMRPKEVGT